MLKPLRVLQTGPGSGRWNTAVSAGLLRKRSADPSCDVVRFYSFMPCLLLGQTEDLAAAAPAQSGPPQAVEVARRITGGGAVYMSESMLAWDFLTDFAARREVLSERAGTAVATALGRLGWPDAVFVPPNDISINGGKVSGAATASRGQAFLHQGTLLLRDEVPAMARCLGVPAEVLQARVTCLEAHGALPAVEAIRSAIVEALAEEFALCPRASSLSPQEHAFADEEYAAEIGRDGYIFGDVAVQGGQA